MITARIMDDAPSIKCYIRHDAPVIKGILHNEMPTIKGVINAQTPFITGRIVKAIDHAAEPYYEVANQYGTTIIIGD